MQKPACLSRWYDLFLKYAPLAAALLTLPLWYPLGLGLLLGWAARPIARSLPRLGKAAQPLAAALLCAGFAGMCLLLRREFSAIGEALPSRLGDLQAIASRLDGLPPAMQAAGERLIALLAGTGRTLAYGFAQIGRLSPDGISALCFTLSALLLPQDAHWDAKKLPRMAAAWAAVKKRLLRAARWLRKNAARLAACFVPAAIGGLFLDCPLLFGGLLTLLEAVWPFGAGWALLPMAFGAAILRDTAACAGWALLYFALLLRRACLPLPKWGLRRPLPTLAAAYVGYRVLGPVGLLAALPFAVFFRR